MVVTRNSSVDAIKGILIFGVVLGHMLLGKIDENIVRYVIYSFHMPAFFFVCGYLINVDKLSTLSMWQLLAKYWKRMIAMWSVAFAIYTIYSVYAVYGYFNVKYVLGCIYTPYYHLWFVPSLFMMILINVDISQKTNDS